MKFFKQNYTRYGLLMTGVVIVCLFLMEVTGQNKTVENSPFVTVFTLIAPAIIWLLGLLSKKKELKGNITFKQGALEALKMSLVYGLTSPFVFMFYYLFINPEILESIRKVYQMTGAADSVVIATDMTVQFLGALIGETLYGTIIAFFIRTKNKKK